MAHQVGALDAEAVEQGEEQLHLPLPGVGHQPRRTLGPAETVEVEGEGAPLRQPLDDAAPGVGGTAEAVDEDDRRLVAAGAARAAILDVDRPAVDLHEVVVGQAGAHLGVRGERGAAGGETGGGEEEKQGEEDAHDSQ
jgi:hypothetical protein